MILAFETSCDHTSIALGCQKTGKIIDVLKISQLDHEKWGGVVPELASRKHFQNILPLMKEIMERNQIKYSDITYIAATYAPGLLGALLVGVTAAKTTAYTLGLPLVAVHHMEGHIMSAFMNNDSINYPLLAVVVSGGHTFLCVAESFGHYKIIGDTIDDSAGEAFDKVARMLSLPYPGGPHIDKLAQNGKNPVKFPRPLINSGDLNFSFSGLKTAVKVYIERNPDTLREDIAAGFQNAVVDILIKKTLSALEQNNIKNVVITGGVAANSQIREEFLKLKSTYNIIVPEKKDCTDNAGMILKAAFFRIKNNFNVLSGKEMHRLNPVAYMKLDKETVSRGLRSKI